MIRYYPEKTKIYGREFRETLVFGVPSGIQSSLFGVANVTIQSAVNSFGAAYIAAHATAFTLENFIVIATVSLGSTGITFMSQNIGAGKNERVIRIIRDILLFGVSLEVAMGLVLILFRYPLMRFFTSDPDIIRIGCNKILFLGCLYSLEVVYGAFSSAVKCYGHTILSMIIILMCCCVFRVIFLQTVFRLFPRFEVLLTIWPISWILASIFMAIAYLKVRPKTIKTS